MMQPEGANVHNPFGPEMIPRKDNKRPVQNQMNSLSLDMAWTSAGEPAYQNLKYNLWPWHREKI